MSSTPTTTPPIEPAAGAGLLRRAKAAAMPLTVRAVSARRKKIALAIAAAPEASESSQG